MHGAGRHIRGQVSAPKDLAIIGEQREVEAGENRRLCLCFRTRGHAPARGACNLENEEKKGDRSRRLTEEECVIIQQETCALGLVTGRCEDEREPIF